MAMRERIAAGNFGAGSGGGETIAELSQQVTGFILTSAKIFQFLPVTCRVSGRHATGRKENLTACKYMLEKYYHSQYIDQSGQPMR